MILLKEIILGDKMLETDLTRIEEKIMKVIWGSEEKMHLKTIVAGVNGLFHKEWRPQTISTYLAHLVRKGYLSFARSGKVFLYTAEVTEQEYFEHEVRNEFEYFSEFSLVDFLNTFPDEQYTKEEIEKIKMLLS